MTSVHNMHILFLVISFFLKFSFTSIFYAMRLQKMVAVHVIPLQQKDAAAAIYLNDVIDTFS